MSEPLPPALLAELLAERYGPLPPPPAGRPVRAYNDPDHVRARRRRLLRQAMREQPTAR